MKDNESDGSIYTYLHTIETNHVRLQSYLTLYAVYKTLNTTEYYIYTKLFFVIKVKKMIKFTVQKKNYSNINICL